MNDYAATDIARGVETLDRAEQLNIYYLASYLVDLAQGPFSRKEGPQCLSF
jgi:hypothetical protein